MVGDGIGGFGPSDPLVGEKDDCEVSRLEEDGIRGCGPRDLSEGETDAFESGFFGAFNLIEGPFFLSPKFSIRLEEIDSANLVAENGVKIGRRGAERKVGGGVGVVSEDGVLTSSNKFMYFEATGSQSTIETSTAEAGVGGRIEGGNSSRM